MRNICGSTKLTEDKVDCYGNVISQLKINREYKHRGGSKEEGREEEEKSEPGTVSGEAILHHQFTWQ